MCKGGLPLKTFLFISWLLIFTAEYHASLAGWPDNFLQH